MSSDIQAGPTSLDNRSLERELTEERTLLESRLRQQLGPGFATSTPGIQVLADFDQRAIELQEAERHAE